LPNPVNVNQQKYLFRKEDKEILGEYKQYLFSILDLISRGLICLELLVKLSYPLGS